MRDLASNIGVVLALSPAVQAATIKGNAVDLQDYESAALILNSGAIVGAGSFAAKLQEADTTADGDFTDVPADLLVGVLPTALAADATVKQSYIGHKRYVRVVVAKNSGTSVAVGAVFVLGHARNRPVA
ncbi:hypothetical protein HNR60_000904 [Rhodopseudomonas rhenobacensis]|uniref:Uncharacterized protein n=1 Tax=Rhodopseudomonas rhenobacensis TaxID=87461 RepID=A0A7W7Z1E1_9BRAD|nr:hypothetical protein [Rhodopseudomonas rhenobacensis]MBB5046162.1 hypothetical protein [Rhodopseudomonas rhenobacensis]